MDNTPSGFSVLRHGLPLTIVIAGLVSALLALKLPVPDGGNGEPARQLSREARLVGTLVQRHLEVEKPGTLQSELDAIGGHLHASLVLYFDNDGTVLASSQPEFLGRQLDALNAWLPGCELDPARILATVPTAAGSFELAVRSGSNGQLLDGLYAVNYPNGASAAGSPLGYLLMREAIADPLQARVLLSLGILLPSLLLAGLVHLFFTHYLRTRLNTLIEAHSRFAVGDLGIRVQGLAEGELGRLQEAFNQMADDVSAFLLLLRRRAARLDEVFDGLPEFLFIVHADGSILEQRGGNVRNLPNSPRDFIGRKITEILPAGLQHVLATAVQEAVLGQKTSTVRYDLQLPTGHEFYEAQLRPIRDDQIIVLIRNITDRQRMEQAAHVREVRLVAAEAGGSVGSWYWELESDTGIWSDGLYRIFGLPKSATVTFDRFLATVLPEDVTALLAHIEDVVHGRPAGDPAFRIVTPAGAVRRLRSSIAPITTNGVVTALQGTVMDLTALSQADEVLQEFFSKGPQCMAIVSAGGKLQRVNLAMAALLGVTPKAMQQETFWRFIAAAEVSKARSFINRALAAGNPVEATLRCVTATGDEAQVNWRAAAAADRQRVFLVGYEASDDASRRGQVVSLTLMHRDTSAEQGPDSYEHGTWRYELGTETLQWSPATYRILDADPAQRAPSLGSMLAYFGPATARKDLVLAIHRCLEYGQDFLLKLDATGTAGRKVPVQISGRRQGEGGSAVLLGTVVQLYAQSMKTGEVLTLPAGNDPNVAPGKDLIAPKPADPLQQIVDTLERESRADYALIALLDSSATSFTQVVAGAMPASYLEIIGASGVGIGEGVCSAAAATGNLLAVTDIALDPIYEHTRSLAMADGLRRSAATPIVAVNGTPIGVVGLYYRTAGNFNDLDLRLVREAARVATRVLTGAELSVDRAPAGERNSDYAAVVETSPVPIMTVDLHGKILTVNAAVLRALGYRREDLVGQSLIKALLHDSSLPQFEQALESASLGASCYCNFQFRAQHGEFISMAMKSAPLMIGDQAGLVLVRHGNEEPAGTPTAQVLRSVGGPSRGSSTAPKAV